MTQTRKQQGHSHIYFSMQELGYKPNPDGCCAGITETIIDKFLIDELTFVNELLISIYHTWEKILSAKQNCQNYDSLLHEFSSPLHQEFFNSISHYQNPEDYSKYSCKYFSQFKIQQISKSLGNQKLEEKGGKQLVDEYLSFYTLSDLQKFFTFIHDYISESKLGISLSVEGHRVGLCFDGRFKKWNFINARHLPVHQVKLEELSSILTNCHSEKIQPISIRLFTTGEDQALIKNYLSELKQNIHFKALHEITQEKISHTTFNKMNLLHYAAFYNHISIFENLVNYYSDVNVVSNFNETPLYIAAYHDHYSIAKKLLQHPTIKIDLPDQFGRTPLYVASRNKSERMVKLLLEHGASPVCSISKPSFFSLPITSRYNTDSPYKSRMRAKL